MLPLESEGRPDAEATLSAAAAVNSLEMHLCNELVSVLFRGQVDSAEGSPSTDVKECVGMSLADLFEALLQVLARLSNIIKKLLGIDDLEDLFNEQQFGRVADPSVEDTV